MWTTLNLRVDRKTRKWARDICKGTLDIECERDWPVSLGAMLGVVVILLGFECTVNPQNLIKIVGAIFEEIKILNFFLMWTTLNFEGRSKKKLEIYARGP